MDELTARRARIFGSLAEEYDRVRPGYPDDAVDWLLPPGAVRVVDLAAGTGKLTDSLIRRGLDVVAIEPDPEMLSVLRRKHPDLEIHQASGEHLPLPDADADAVLVAQAWHWFDGPRTYAEVSRVLRPGGRLGLIGHAPTPTEPWEHELAALEPAGPATSPPTEPGLPDLPDVPIESATFPWVREIAPADVAALYGTYSRYAVLEPVERAARLAAVAAVAQREANRRGRPAVRMTSVIHCDRVGPRDIGNPPGRAR